MKKWYLILSVLFLAIVIGIVLPIWRGYKVKAYLDEVTIHSAVHDVYNDTVGETADGAVRMSQANLYYFEKAVTRSGLVYRSFRPTTAEMPYVTVTYHDGAEFRIVDGGTTNGDKDLAYIIYSYDGRCTCFALTG
jgi:hypothetical protein